MLDPMAAPLVDDDAVDMEDPTAVEGQGEVAALTDEAEGGGMGMRQEEGGEGEEEEDA